MEAVISSPKTVRVVAPARPLNPLYRDRLNEIMATGQWPDLKIEFDEQCFFEADHFSGTDEQRRAAFLAAANDPSVDVIWFARGGYGSLRIVPGLVSDLTPAASEKTYIGYSDMGFLFGSLYKNSVGTLVHGPMLGDLARDGGEAAIERVLSFLSDPGSDAGSPDAPPKLAFNLTVLALLVASGEAADMTGHELLLEDVGEYHYSLDRSMAVLYASGILSKLAGLRAGRFSRIPTDKTDVPFGKSAVEILEHWCKRAGIPMLGEANIGHDVENDIVVFGSR